MAQVSKYRYLLNQYPETVQKEQFRIICHNLYHCDRDGVYLYIDAVSGQLADAIGKNEG